MLCSSHTTRRRHAVRDWLRQLLTGKDNLSPDVVKIIGALMGVQFIINSAWALVVREQTWDPSAYGTGSSLLRSEEHTSELQSLMRISYAVFCLKKHIFITPHNTTILVTHNDLRRLAHIILHL